MTSSTHFKIFLQRLVEYNGIIFHFNSMASSYVSNYKQSIGNKFILGSKLIYRHPVTMKHTWPDTVYMVDRKNLEQSVEMIQKYISNHFAAQAYEAFETYLYAVTAKAAMTYPRNLKKIRKFLRNTNQKDYKTQLGNRYKNCNELYANATLKLIPNLENDIKNKYTGYEKFAHFLKCYTLARNSITHSDSILRQEELKNLLSYDMTILKEFFGVTLNKKRSLYSINTSKEVKTLIGTLVQLGSLIESYMI